MTHQMIQPPGWAAPKGYANGVLTGSGILHIGGQIGWNADQVFEAEDFVAQAEQALLNIRQIVETAGGAVEDITRLTWFVTDKTEYLSRQEDMGAAYRRVLGRHFPAMSMLVVAGLIEDRALVEIEATAEISGGAHAL
ncbi:MAG: RidA family protein [Pseudomonadota bacterium]